MLHERDWNNLREVVMITDGKRTVATAGETLPETLRHDLGLIALGKYGYVPERIEIPLPARPEGVRR